MNKKSLVDNLIVLFTLIFVFIASNNKEITYTFISLAVVLRVLFFFINSRSNKIILKKVAGYFLLIVYPGLLMFLRNPIYYEVVRFIVITTVVGSLLFLLFVMYISDLSIFSKYRGNKIMYYIVMILLIIIVLTIYLYCYFACFSENFISGLDLICTILLIKLMFMVAAEC